MKKSVYSRGLLALVPILFNVLWLSPIAAQERNGTITGHVMDANQGALAGARVEVQPLGRTVVSDAQGQFSIRDLAPGKYTVAVSYVAFTPFSKEVEVAPGGVANVDATLQIESVNEQVIVRGEREHGEVEAINREMTSDNIVQVLPAEVITSLPNTNIADALGRLPSVSLERDEGEGKYVQIRGTEPRLTNTTLDGVHVPSPEAVRQLKMDAIPADLIDSVEINKTLSANQEGDAIGGTVNLVTKRAGDVPFLSLAAMAGYTPVGLGGRLDEFDATYGRKFGAEKRLGLLFGGSYDFNRRGTDDIEPSQGVNPIFGNPPDTNTQTGQFSGPNAMDVRQYTFYRHRIGFVGSADYKLGQDSFAYLRSLFSEFLDNGEDWIYTPAVGTFTSPTTTNPDGTVDYSHVIRRPHQRIFNVIAGARHTLGSTTVSYEVALGQGRSTGGFYSAHFSGPQNVQYTLDTSDPFLPKFVQVNTTPQTDMFNPANYTLGGPNFNFFRTISMSTDNHIFERDLTGSISVARQYRAGSHFGAFEVGFKIRDAHKSQNFKEPTFDINTDGLLALNSVARPEKNPGYYSGNYKLLPFSDFDKLLAYFKANRSQFTENTNFEHLIQDSNDFLTRERVVAGYVMNTINVGRFRVVAGLRIEGTQGSFLGTIALFNPDRTFASDTPAPGAHAYTDFLPSVSVQYNINASTNIRAVYGRGIARPNFSDLPPSASIAQSTPVKITAGNENLIPTHANDYDVLFEHYLKTVGIVEAGWFYKALSDPIFQIVTTLPSSSQFPGAKQKQPVNGRGAHITGVEFAWQQHLTFLPGGLNGMGVSANYSYTTSKASFPIDPNDPMHRPTRADSPALLRQAPNTWNFDATYDKGPISARMGLSHNDANISAYFYTDNADGGIKGPNGDQYFYPHTQVDAQVNYRLPHGHGIHLVVSMLNLTNEVFGYYLGSEQYPIQREYYSRTISGGLRWTSSAQ